MNGFDLVIGASLLLGGIIGGKIGLFRSLSSFVGYFLALILTRWTAPHAVKFVTENTPLNDRISQWIAEKTGIQQWEAQYAIWMNDPEVKAAIAQQGFGQFESLMGQQASMSDTGAHVILLVLCIIVLFIGFKIFLLVGFKWIELLLQKLPLHHTINKWGGALLGLVTAIMLTTIATAVWSPFSVATDIGAKPYLNTQESWFAIKWVPLTGLDQFLPFQAATNWFAPMMAGSERIAVQANASDASDKNDLHHQQAPASENLVTLAAWFGLSPATYEEKEISAHVDCHAGNCPDWDVITTVNTYDCWFCSSEWVGIQGDQFILESDGSVQIDTLAGCTERSEGPILNGMRITHKTDNLLVVQGVKTFKNEHFNRCASNYKATVEVEVEWRFHKGK